MKFFRIDPIGTEANTYVVWDEQSGEAAVFDPGKNDPRIYDILKNGEIKSLKYICLTHGHFDHIMGVHDLKEATGAQVVIHSLDAPCLMSDKESLNTNHAYGIQKFLSPDILLEDGMELNLHKVKFRVMHTPGHTLGGVSFIFDDEKLIISGDTLFRHTIGRTDLPGGDYNALMASVKKLTELPGDYRVYPGHNRHTRLSEERKNNRYLRKLNRA